MGTNGVGEHQSIFAILVFGVIVDAFLLEQAADEVEIGLAILDAVFPLRITRCQRVFDVGDPALL